MYSSQLLFITLEILISYVNGQWSAWRRFMTGQCLPNCQRLVFIQRVCTNPAPSAGGRPCIGVDKDTTSEACREGLCLKVDGRWSEWRRFMTGQCLPNCQRLVFIQRVCTNPAPSAGGRPCIGVDKDTISETCTKGLCLKASGHWSEWTRLVTGQCLPTCRRFVFIVRVCTTANLPRNRMPCIGVDKNTHREKCTGELCQIVTGQWSTWTRHIAGQCLPSCQRLVFIQRVCTHPTPSQEGLPCIGIDRDVITEYCTGRLCSRMHGEWSSWIKSTIGQCSTSCQRTVTLRRECSKPPPAGGGHRCHGNDTTVITEMCGRPGCVISRSTASWNRESSEIHSEILLVCGICGLIIITTVIFFFSLIRRRKKTDIRDAVGVTIINTRSYHEILDESFK